MSTDAPTPDTIVLIHGFWVTPAQLGALDRPLRGQGLPRARARLPGLRGRGRGAQRRPHADRGADGAGDHRAPRGGRRRARRRRRSSSGHSAGGVFTQILLDHGFGAAGVAINSAPTEGVKRRPALADQGDVPGAQEPGQPPPGRRLHARAVALRVHQHVQRGGVARALRALPHPRVRARSSGAARWPTSTPATTTPRSTTTTTTARRCCSSPAARTTSCRRAIQRSNAKHYKSDTITEVKEFEGPHLLPAAPGLGGGRRLRARLGARPRRAAERARDGRPHHPHRRPDRADRGRRLAAADRPDVRPARPQVPLRLGDGRRASWPGPAIAAADLGPIDAVLLTPRPPRRQPRPRRAGAAAVGRRRRHHGLGRAAPRRRRARASSRGRPRAWRRRDGRRSRSRRRRAATGRRCSHPIVGDVIGFALRWDGQEHGVLWISGDTVLYDGVREVADRLRGRHRAPAPRRRALPGHRARCATR